MNNTKVFGIQEDNFYEFIKKINEFYSKSRVFATQTHYQEGKWFGIIYFESGLAENQGKSFVKGKPPFDNSGKLESPNNSLSNSPDYLSPKQSYFFKIRKLPFPASYEEAVETISQIKEREAEI